MPDSMARSSFWQVDALDAVVEDGWEVDWEMIWMTEMKLGSPPFFM